MTSAEGELGRRDLTHPLSAPHVLYPFIQEGELARSLLSAELQREFPVHSSLILDPCANPSLSPTPSTKTGSASLCCFLSVQTVQDAMSAEREELARSRLSVHQKEEALAAQEKSVGERMSEVEVRAREVNEVEAALEERAEQMEGQKEEMAAERER